MVNFFNKNFRIAVITHTQYRDHKSVHGSSDTLVDFMKANLSGDIFYIKHSIFKGDGSFFEHYKDGHLQSIKKNVNTRNFINTLRYLLDFFITLKWLNIEKTFDFIIAVDPLNFFYTYFMKKFKKANKIVFYTQDFAYQRFENMFLNKIYHYLDLFAVKRADMIWNSCQKVKKIRDRQMQNKTRNIYLPNMPIDPVIRVKNQEEIEFFSLVNIFSNPKQIDFSIMFDALERLFEFYPNIKLKLIGRGDFANEIFYLIKDKKIKDCVQCLDIPSHIKALEEVSRCAIGLECNAHTEAWNEFREPLKIMEYITFGLPILTKSGHGMVDEIVKNRMGFVVTDQDSLFQQVHSLFSNKELYSEIRSNVLNYAKKINKSKIIVDSISELIKSSN